MVLYEPYASYFVTSQYTKVTKLTSDAKFEEGDIKASVSAVAFILSSAAKHSVDGQSLDNELQQLGLPKGTVSCVCECVCVCAH